LVEISGENIIGKQPKRDVWYNIKFLTKIYKFYSFHIISLMWGGQKRSTNS
jgi:hypothetical protein